MLDVGENGIEIAFWLEYYMGTAMIGLWIHPEKRHSVGSVRKVLRMYKYIFDSGLRSVIGITKQPELLAEHERLGYTVLGMIPGIYGGEDGWLVVLTAEDFLAKWGDKIEAEGLTLDLAVQPVWAQHAKTSDSGAH